MHFEQLCYLAVAWAGYFAVHSALASLGPKRWVDAHFPRLARHYRAVYNLVALVLLVPPLWLLHTAQGELLWRWHGMWRWLADGLALAAIACFLWSLRYYDMGEFLGLSGDRRPGPRSRLILSPLHRHVRHPWYTCGLVIIWTFDMDPAWLVSCLAFTLYFIVGSYWEEQKLVAEYGEVYRRYQRRVPGLIPVPGRRLCADEAEAIVAETNQRQVAPFPRSDKSSRPS